MSMELESLRRRIEEFPLDDPDASFPFTARLARENGWSRGYAERVAREYKRFIYLMAVAGHPVSPSEDVDQAWHLHLVYTKSYWDELCEKVVGQPLHHGPTNGSDADGKKFRDWYRQTLASYETHFGMPAPAEIWPAVEERFANASEGRWVDKTRYWIVPKPRMGMASSAVLAGVIALGMIAWAAPNANAPWPFSLDGESFLYLYIVLFVIAIGLGVFIRRWQARQSLDMTEDSAPKLDPIEMGVLTGDQIRAFSAVLFSLLRRGSLVSREDKGWSPLAKFHFSTKPSNHQATLPIEQAIIAAAADRETTLTELWDAARLQSGKARWSLIDKGLLWNPNDGSGSNWWAALPLFGLALLGSARTLQGILNDRPVGFLIVLVIVTLVAIPPMVFLRSKQTPRGKALERELRSKGESIQRQLKSDASTVTPDIVLLGVALFGTDVLEGPEKKTLVPAIKSLAIHLKKKHRGKPAGGCGGGVGIGACGGGGGCGSGCGGGGCGGCGGGN